MNPYRAKRLSVHLRSVSLGLALTLCAAALLGGCVYFNTMYNAKKHFRNAEKQNNPEEGGRRMTANRRLYEDAIAKAVKIVQKHPKSKYHDDALFMIGVSYFRIDNYSKSEGAFRELIAVHPQSDFAEESQLYLARCRMQLGDEQAAFRTFTELSATAQRPEWRAEAMYQRGIYLADNENHDSAVAAFRTILDEYPKSERVVDARLKGAESLRLLKRPLEALVLYQPLTDETDDLLRYPALIGTGEAYYEANLVDSGIAIFSQMVEDGAYVDSIGTTRLKLADGLERRGDINDAWRQYEQVAAALEHTRWSAEAYFNMAEIKQYQHNDLISAKEYYDRVREENAAGELANLALTRSANITKLAEFRKSLGRGELSRSAGGSAAGEYDPESLPRHERLLQSSPMAAKPADFVHSSVAQKHIQDSLAALMPMAEAGSSDPSSDHFMGPLQLIGPIPSESPDGADPARAQSGAAPDLSSDSVTRPNPEIVLLAHHLWEDLSMSTSLFGPPPPAQHIEFGAGNLFGPVRPAELPEVAAPPIDSTVFREREARMTKRAERAKEFSEIETAATTQLQLAELYRFDLAYPESALVEYNDVVERFPGTPFAAKALVASADVYATDFDDTVSANVRLRRALNEYPHTDYAGDAIVRLGMQGTSADTGHPAHAYAAAEAEYLVHDNPREAIRQFKAFIDRYPQSRLLPRAEYAIVAITDRAFPSEDSSLIWAYQEINVAYAQTPLAVAASERLTTNLVRPKPRTAPALAAADDKTDPRTARRPGENAEDDTVQAERLPRAPRPKFVGQTVFPSSEVNVITTEVVVVYRILIDFSGNIAEHELIKKSPSPDLDEATLQALKQTTFNPDSIAAESLNIWYQYEIRVTPPAREHDPNDPLDVYFQNNPSGQP